MRGFLEKHVFLLPNPPFQVLFIDFPFPHIEMQSARDGSDDYWEPVVWRRWEKVATTVILLQLSRLQWGQLGAWLKPFASLKNGYLWPPGHGYVVKPIPLW